MFFKLNIFSGEKNVISLKKMKMISEELAILLMECYTVYTISRSIRVFKSMINYLSML